MNVQFVKMSGAGNDMILVDHRDGAFSGREGVLARVACHRRFGVGADGLILLENDPAVAFRVRFFNPDGGEYSLCGNGARCIPFYAAELGIPGPVYRFRSNSGDHEGQVISDRRASVVLPPVRSLRLDIPAEVDGRPVTLDQGDIGVPHAALWVEDSAAVPIARWGPALRSHPAFGPEGTNVSFVQRLAPGRLRIRTFERGVEDETWACGSGSAVIATLARERGWAGDQVDLEVRGGHLTLRLGETGTPPVLEGPVHRICDGQLRFDPPGAPTA